MGTCASLPLTLTGTTLVLTPQSLGQQTTVMVPGLTTTLTQTTITPGSAYSAVATLVFGDGSTSLASAPSTTFAIGRLADCSTPSAGPGGRPCAAGALCIDVVPFDGAFKCSCENLANVAGPNCDPAPSPGTPQGTAPVTPVPSPGRGSSGSGSAGSAASCWVCFMLVGILAGLLFCAACLLLTALLLLRRWRRAPAAREQAHEAEEFRIETSGERRRERYTHTLE